MEKFFARFQLDRDHLGLSQLLSGARGGNLVSLFEQRHDVSGIRMSETEELASRAVS